MGHDLDDDYAVYPFRRVLVEETVVDLPPALPRRPRPAPARRSTNPLKVAVPLALTTFVVAVAGAATITDHAQVSHALGNRLVPPAEAAGPKRTHAAPQLLFVPDVTGLKTAAAVKLLKQKGFVPHLRRIKGKPIVLEQTPKAATSVRRAGIVLVVTGGRKAKPKPKPAPVVVAKVIVTSVVGLDRDTAVHALQNEGLGIQIFGVPSSKPAGTVVAQAPAAGHRAKAGSDARISASVG